MKKIGEKKAIEELLLDMSGYEGKHGHGHYHHANVEKGAKFEKEILKEDRSRLLREIKNLDEDREWMEKEIKEIDKKLK